MADTLPRIPLTSLIFGYGPILPLPIAALMAWTLPPPVPTVVMWLAIWWAASILIFLAGVRRGRSFRGDEEARAAPLIAMVWLFLLGAGALVSPTPLMSLVLLAIGYASVAILDPIAARRGEAPPHFARLRPPQMGVALIGLIGLIVHHATLTMPV
ncbi:DUF3429 domain-containing protein [Sphingomonas oryzagri]